MLSAIPAFLAAVLQAASFTCDKAILNIRRISYKTYTAVSFPLLLLFDCAIWAIFRPRLDWGLLDGQIGVLVIASILTLVVTNLLYYRALKEDQLSEINVVSLTAAIPVILVNGLIFADERRLAIVVPALVAALAVVWAHWENHRLHFAKHTPSFLLWLWFTAPLNAAAAKVILHTWSPITLELVRDGVMALILLPLFHASIKRIPARGWWLLLATNALSSSAWMLYFLGYQRIGVIASALVFSLQPLLVYFAGVVILKEPFAPRKFIAFLIVLASIAVSQLI
jgi:drug/metabolite transporter (DMT)-like permease